MVARTQGAQPPTGRVGETAVPAATEDAVAGAAPDVTPEAAGDAARDGPRDAAQEVTPENASLAARGVAGPSRAVVFSLLALLVLLIAVIPLRHDGAVAPVNYGRQLAGARADAPYHVLAPDSLPAGWLVTRATYDPDVSGAATWHLGLITPSGRYAGVAQSNGPWRLFEMRQSNRGLPHGEISVDGKLWRRQYRKERDVRTLVRMSGGVTTVVSGTASYEELEVLLRSLR
jgi:hypothetical protein